VKAKVGVALLLACALGVGVTAAASAKAPKKPVPAKFDKRFDCAKVAPAAWLTTLMGGYGGTLTFKPKASSTNVANYPPKKGGVGGNSDCNYSQSAGWSNSAKSEGPVELRIAYGTHALWWYKAMHAGARSAVPLGGLGDQAFDNGNYVAALRGKVFIMASVAAIPNADRTGNDPVPDGLMASVARAVLAKLPVVK
jgi:hypothetical protein